MILAIINFKGGVGKTTTAVTLAHLFAMCGQRVLLVDCDAQGHAGYALGVKRAPGLWNLLTKAPNAQPQDVLCTARYNLDLIPNEVNKGSALKDWLSVQVYRETLLARALRPLAKDYDLIILDAGPSYDVLATNVIHAADGYLVPVAVDTLALAGLTDFVNTISKHREFIGRGLDLVGVVPTLYDARTRESSHNLASLFDKFGDLVTPPVPRDVKAREAPAYGKTLLEYAPYSSAAGAYYLVMQHVADRLRGRA